MRILIVSIALAMLCTACNNSTNDENNNTTNTNSTSESAESPPEASQITLSFELTAEQQSTAATLAESLERNTFPRSAHTVENAPLFLSFLATHDDTRLLTASFHALEEIYRPAGANITEGQNLSVDEDYKSVVIGHLDSSDDKVLAAAISAAGRLINGAPDERDNETAYLLAELATSDRPALRYDALDALRAARTWVKDERLTKPFLDALNADEPYLVSLALFGMKSHAPSLDKDTVNPTLQALTEHADPGVRGRAIEIWARVPGIRDTELKAQIAQRAEAMLDDEHPFVRSVAANSVGHLDHVEAIPALMAMLDDSEKNTYDIDGWTRLDGSAGRVHHDGSPWSRVNDAVLYGLSYITPSDRNLKFKYTAPKHDDVDGGIARAVADARAWYNQHQAALAN